MKVLMINGSPHAKGTTYRALSEVAGELNKNGIETEIVQIGDKVIAGCVGCSACRKLGRCIKDDIVNELILKVQQCDGLVVGSPVYYASLNGTLKCLLDRLFYAGTGFENKPAAAVAVARRAGTTSTIDIINKYFALKGMPIVTSQYWNMCFGSNGEQAEQDGEGMQTMRLLGNNMAYLIKCIKAGEQAGIKAPVKESQIRTNFIK